MQVIFLDVDGVLNNSTTRDSLNHLDGINLQNLVYLVNESGAKVVLSSTWRVLSEYRQTVTDALAKLGVQIYDVTPDFVGCPRVVEIKDWLDRHPAVSAWVALDDDNLETFLQVKTDPEQGLTMADVQEALKKLRKEY